MNYTLKKISKISSGKLYGKPETIISKILIDSRTIVSDKQSLFVAIKGERNNGHDYINELYEKGIMIFLVEYLPVNYKTLSNANFIVVNNSLAALQCIAEYHRQQHHYPVVGITGSNGKTIIKEWIFQLLGDEKRIIRNPKSFNSQVGVPLSILLLESNYDFGIFEAGISQNGEMSKLEKIIQPEIGIFTNIGDAHQENFLNIQQKIKEKLALYINSKFLIYCKDHKEIDRIISEFVDTNKTKLFSWSTSGNADLEITNIKLLNNKTEIEALYENEKMNISIPFTDAASIENAIHVLAFLLSQDLYHEKINKKFNQLSSVAMRLEMMPGINNCTIINDSYNSDLNSIQIALDVLNRQHQHQKKSIIISDILQTGHNEGEIYRKLAQIIEKAKLNRIILVGKKLNKNKNLIKGEKYVFKNTDELLHSHLILDLVDEAILIKGARKFKFDKISYILQQKTHRTLLEINMEAMTHNLNYFRSLLIPATKIMVMVKAFSYGSGSHEIASWLEHQRVDYLGVAFADEGIELRKAGITLPIMVMNPSFESFRNLIDYKLEPELYNFTSLEQFSQIAQQYSVRACPVHIKIDTGMKRLGFEKRDINLLVKKLKELKGVKIKSVFSHLVASDETIHDDFTNKQIGEFEKITKEISSALPYNFIRHILNSSGIERFPNACYEMVRLGIGLYGISATSQSKLMNISTLKTKISQIKTIKANETIGYSRKGKALQDTNIAILPIGYADGLNRKLSNGNGYVYINGKLAPYIGNICMDMSMVDLAGIEANEGDEVIIFGEQNPISKLAEQTGTIPYEILSGISRRVKRVYLY